MSQQSLSKTLQGHQLVAGMAAHAAFAKDLDGRYAACPVGPVSDALGNPLGVGQYDTSQNVCGEDRWMKYDLATNLERDQYLYAQMRDAQPSPGDRFEAIHRANMNHNVGRRPAQVVPFQGQGTLDSFLTGHAHPVFHQ